MSLAPDDEGQVYYANPFVQDRVVARFDAIVNVSAYETYLPSLHTNLMLLRARQYWISSEPQSTRPRILIYRSACHVYLHVLSAFPYVCPEPVLVKSSFLYINGAKTCILQFQFAPVFGSI